MYIPQHFRANGFHQQYGRCAGIHVNFKLWYNWVTHMLSGKGLKNDYYGFYELLIRTTNILQSFIAIPYGHIQMETPSFFYGVGKLHSFKDYWKMKQRDNYKEEQIRICRK